MSSECTGLDAEAEGHQRSGVRRGYDELNLVLKVSRPDSARSEIRVCTWFSPAGVPSSPEESPIITDEMDRFFDTGDEVHSLIG